MKGMKLMKYHNRQQYSGHCLRFSRPKKRNSQKFLNKKGIIYYGN